MPFWLRLNMFFRSFFLQAGWNYVKYQNLGFALVMMPFLRRLYRNDPEALPTVLNRYLEAFNTAKTAAVTDYKEQVMEWNGARRGLSITAASIGDRLFWGSIKPLTLLLAIFIWMILGVDFFETQGMAPVSIIYGFTAGAIAFFVYNTIALFVRWQGIKIGYESDESSCFGLTRFDWNRTIYNAKRIGIFFAVGLMLFGVYRFMAGVRVDVNFVARAVLVLFFVLLSFITRRMRIPNVYLYITAVIIFNIVCLF